MQKKSDLKKWSKIDGLEQARKADWTTWKLDVDRLDIDELETTAVDLCKIKMLRKWRFKYNLVW